MLPVRIVLRDFVARGLPNPGEPATAQHLWRFIERELDSTSLGHFATDLRCEPLNKGACSYSIVWRKFPRPDRRRDQVKQAVEGVAQALVETAELGRTGKRFEIVKERARGWLKSILGGH